MQIKAKVKFIRMSPKKIRLVVDVIRGLEVGEALERLRLMKKEAKQPVIKLLNSAVANAENNFELSKDNLYIKEIKVDEGRTLKRWMPRAHGRATTIRKRMSHILVTLAEIKDTGEKKGKKSEIDDPVKLGEIKKEVKSQKSPSHSAGQAKVKSTATSDKGKTIDDKKVASDKKKEDAFDDDNQDKSQEVVKEIKDPRMEGRRGHARAEGGKKGFASRIFRRKSG